MRKEKKNLSERTGAGLHLWSIPTNYYLSKEQKILLITTETGSFEKAARKAKRLVEVMLPEKVFIREIKYGGIIDA